ncbi:hypothetical protein L195_g006680 [Trifolium pratense]|uniref:Uncharacterized protein n=2 Tax=Trifolium pratense TaxID=57577 RepID=A0A2K3L2Y1_TRIPR|nr:hypothetical protein L195_g050737 [Trifolium pratense]PNX72897.1 hypothetical protein L195_g028795 [Trifolium pratense]PNY10112.1 hypothetical protein L195_g006680 [Trifolium pratense]CAJ2648221.1 unnamed protein product [Trifolium pratense]
MERKIHSSSHTTKTTPPPSKSPASSSDSLSDSHQSQMEQKNHLSRKGKRIKKENVAKKPMPEESPSVIDNEPAKDEFEKGESSDEMPHLCFREMDAFKKGIELLGESERKEFDRRYKKLRVQEVKLRLRRAELVENHVEIILNALQGSS